MAPGFPFKKVVLVGATSGIGRSLAHKMVQQGHFVIVVGRRQENLDVFVTEHGSAKAASSQFDVTDLAAIPAWTAALLRMHPDIDCVLLNSGIQRNFDFAKPATVDLKTVELETTTNYTAALHLSMAFLPHLQSVAAKGEPAALAFTTSVLALIPLVRCANYSASKAALHHWILALREQLKDENPKNPVRAIEILPPSVQTELHDEKHQPDIKNGRSIGMPLDGFTEEVWKQLVAGKDELTKQMAESWCKEGGFEAERQKAFMAFAQRTKQAK